MLYSNMSEYQLYFLLACFFIIILELTSDRMILFVTFNPTNAIIHVELFFGTRRCTRVHRLGMQNQTKLEGGKKYVFLIFTNLGKDMMEKFRKKQTNKQSYLENTCLGCVLKVLVRGWYPPRNTSGPRGAAVTRGLTVVFIESWMLWIILKFIIIKTLLD